MRGVPKRLKWFQLWSTPQPYIQWRQIGAHLTTHFKGCGKGHAPVMHFSDCNEVHT